MTPNQEASLILTWMPIDSADLCFLSGEEHTFFYSAFRLHQVADHKVVLVLFALDRDEKCCSIYLSVVLML